MLVLLYGEAPPSRRLKRKEREKKEKKDRKKRKEVRGESTPR